MAVTAEDVHNIRFERAPLGSRGYNEAEVDEFLDRVAATLEDEDEVTAADVHRIAFSKAPLGKRGYDQASVDDFLRRVESTLVARAPADTTVHAPYIAPALEHSHVRKSLWRRVRG
jgi:DivIVA domain-containing protein